MTLDILVKISKIATPFIILFVGFWLNRSVQKHNINMKLTSEFNTKWSEEFINRCQVFSDTVSEIQFLMHKIAIQKPVHKDILKRYNILLDEVALQKYHIETHSSLIDDTHEIVSVVETIFQQAEENANALRDGGYADFDKIKNSQNNLNKYLKAKQKSVLKL